MCISRGDIGGALQVLENEHVDLVLTDLRLGGEDVPVASREKDTRGWVIDECLVGIKSRGC